MALSDDEIIAIAEKHLVLIDNGEFDFARSIEAEVRKQDDALILQLVEALEWQERPLCMCWAGCGDCNPENAPNAVAAIAAALKRLEGKP